MQGPAQGVGILHDRDLRRLRHDALQADARLHAHAAVLCHGLRRGENGHDLKALFVVAALEIDELGEGDRQVRAAEPALRGPVQQAEPEHALAHRLAPADLFIRQLAAGAGVHDPRRRRRARLQGQGVAQQHVLFRAFAHQTHGVFAQPQLYAAVRRLRAKAQLLPARPYPQREKQRHPHAHSAGSQHLRLCAAHPARNGAAAALRRNCAAQGKGQIHAQLLRLVPAGGLVQHAHLYVSAYAEDLVLALPAAHERVRAAADDALHIARAVRNDGFSALLLPDRLIQNAMQIRDLHLPEFHFHRITPCRF